MRINKTITITAGTPVNANTGTAAGDTTPLYASDVMVQMKTGGSGRGYVMDSIGGIVGGVPRVPAATNSADLTQELEPATATAPGGKYSDTDLAAGIDINQLWFDGSNTGDKLTLSFRPRT